MHNTTLGLRMRSARTRARLSLEEVGRRVAQAVGRPRPYSAQAVQQWEVGKKVKGRAHIEVRPDPEELLAFARVVGLSDTTWLVSGVEVTSSGVQENTPSQGRVVAIITAEQAVRRPIDYTSEHHVHTQVPCSKKSFGFTIWDTRNSPEFQPGDRVTIDPEATPEPGAMVFAVAGGHPIFARYMQPQRRRSQWSCRLDALNRAWPAIAASSKGGDRIIGVMVEYTKPGMHPRLGDNR